MATRQRRMWIVLALALGSGGLSAYLALTFLRIQKPLHAAPPSGAHVVVAAQDLKVGSTVRATDVRLGAGQRRLAEGVADEDADQFGGAAGSPLSVHL